MGMWWWSVAVPVYEESRKRNFFQLSNTWPFVVNYEWQSQRCRWREAKDSVPLRHEERAARLISGCRRLLTSSGLEGIILQARMRQGSKARSVFLSQVAATLLNLFA
ncbi:uncharacterized protein MYCFIDRAFT_205681 [Pseudocercospora fijiensis CIRAD86]|uniref:Uncharacterized protein n=1 Tax=Pseudocercospora fijiensis (strain CIRAD86) TaxID=383855 RepID=N1Q991_PSEFD|nr:uncharacterized protein MYCFIDRAFT_205681 [Pseudocercospora fijiensis CIRAD86]EME87462.1 hypothetical protein MYCFIDRAFT_205681 [Pseudocercospora fijiensis CIRAD86]